MGSGSSDLSGKIPDFPVNMGFVSAGWVGDWAALQVIAKAVLKKRGGGRITWYKKLVTVAY